MSRARQFKQRWKRTVRYLYLRFMRLRGTPEEISRGFAFGVFWGMFPLPGLQMAIAILTAVVFRASKIAAAAGTWLSNPLTTLPFTALNFHVGQTVLRREWQDFPQDGLRSIQDFFQLGTDVITSYLMGCLVVGAIVGIVSYFIGIPVVAWVQEQNAKRRSRRRWRRHHSR